MTSVPSTAASPGTASAGASAGLSGLNQADFIRLLTAQLQHQDPTSPTKPQDLANEFAQLSTVSGINALTQEVSKIGAGAGAAEIGQAANLIGKTVAIAGNPLAVANANGRVIAGFSLAGPASSATVTITDPQSGKVVYSQQLSNLPSGMNDFSWTGGAAGHVYSYKVSASSGSSNVAATTYTNTQVRNIDLTGGTPTLSLAGAAQPADLTQIVSILGG
ncbi:hypothetical protein U879_11750 [Defluviimonas sp. 20V17]|uniref:Basal-body rod modification protein FlgD n=1 Tax=Allgaiera indica TaxID=765699 RepID=A0AAN4UN15_9RHOB|nr:flagellar hook capping FlgD N-terminal domain-containing protein [Allgaiera indica]KDB03485.1 hypothetical protein U879_11750 [Defluviimonas sp. 20V17]GHD98124.1 basal-body rod modification protein FlgD [Allgaiera indica]SDW53397.1 flagellar basal-body rod modification protein FlgD [Allgaiera indica]